MKKFLIKEQESGLTLEKYVKKVLNVAPLSFIYKLFRKKDVKVNGHWQDKKYIISAGEEVSIFISDAQLEEFVQQNKHENNNVILKSIVYEDKNILIINKPRGLLVQPDSSNDVSLDKMVCEYLSNGDEFSAFTPGPVHRLDRNTSGLIVFGKNIQTLQYLSEIFKDHELINKHYLALVVGDVKEDGIVDKPLYKGSNNMVYVSDKEEAKPAQTIYHVLDRFGEYTLLDVILLTGRSHQIRVHMASINHPVVGDEKYGDFEVNKKFFAKYKFKNQFLHAHELCFGEVEEPLRYLRNTNFVAKLPSEFTKILEDLKGE